MTRWASEHCVLEHTQVLLHRVGTHDKVPHGEEMPPRGGRHGGHPLRIGAHLPHCFRSTLSLAFPSAVVCHCMLVGSSGPPHASGMM